MNLLHLFIIGYQNHDMFVDSTEGVSDAARLIAELLMGRGEVRPAESPIDLPEFKPLLAAPMIVENNIGNILSIVQENRQLCKWMPENVCFPEPGSLQYPFILEISRLGTLVKLALANPQLVQTCKPQQIVGFSPALLALVREKDPGAAGCVDSFRAQFGRLCRYATAYRDLNLTAIVTQVTMDWFRQVFVPR